MSNIAKNEDVVIADLPDTQLVDRIGELMALIAPLEEQLDAAKAALKARGNRRYYGDLFDANVFETIRSVLDMKAVRAKLSDQFIRAHTTDSTSVVCKVTARLVRKAA